MSCAVLMAVAGSFPRDPSVNNCACHLIAARGALIWWEAKDRNCDFIRPNSCSRALASCSDSVILCMCSFCWISFLTLRMRKVPNPVARTMPRTFIARKNGSFVKIACENRAATRAMVKSSAPMTRMRIKWLRTMARAMNETMMIVESGPRPIYFAFPSCTRMIFRALPMTAVANVPMNTIISAPRSFRSVLAR